MIVLWLSLHFFKYEELMSMKTERVIMYLGRHYGYSYLEQMVIKPSAYVCVYVSKNIVI